MLKNSGKSVFHQKGIASRLKKTRIKPENADNALEIEWIPKHIQMKTCVKYVANAKTKDFCLCGMKRIGHTPVAISAGSGQLVWDLTKDTEHSPTAAFGEIEFPNNNVAKYVRVANDTPMSTMVELLTEVWGLQKPNLLISVTGGARDFKLPKKLLQTFKHGLLKTAQSTGAWIVSGGMPIGVMKYVGESVSVLSSASKVVALGVATWGRVQNKASLTNSEGNWPCLYGTVREGKMVPLCQNHTHFVLVDDGTCGSFGKEIDFRGRLEKTITEIKSGSSKKDLSIDIPAVCLVVEGGPGTIRTAKSSIMNSTPVVVLQGSGRAADILAYAYNNCVEEEIESFDLKGCKTIERIPTFPAGILENTKALIEAESWKDSTDEMLQAVKDCVLQRHLMVVFSLDGDKSGVMTDIDLAMLNAIMRANTNNVMTQLKLAFAWNRCDIVKEELFVEANSFDKEILNDILVEALLENKVEFVELLLDHVHLGSFLNVRRLLELYNRTPPSHMLYRMLMKEKNTEKVTFDLTDVGNIIRDLIGDFYKPLYTTDEKKRYQDIDVDGLVSGIGREYRIKSFQQELGDQEVDTLMLKLEETFSYPAREMFIWSVLLLKKELALLFFNEERYAIAPALTAASLTKAMAKQTMDSELIEDIEEITSEFEEIAVGVLNECYAADESKAKLLILRRLRLYGDTTALQLAVEATNKRFVAQQCSQQLLNNIWWGRMDQYQSNGRIFACILCPLFLLIPGVIKYREDESSARRVLPLPKRRFNLKNTPKKRILDIPVTEVTSTRPRAARTSIATAHNFDPRFGRLSFTQKCIGFYNAPRVTFAHNCVMYLLFLLLFSYVMLCNYHPPPTVFDYILYVWIFTLIIEEARQFALADSSNMGAKFHTYFYDTWNIVDILTISFFLMGTILRHIPDCDSCFEWSRILMSLSLMTFFFRILHILSVFRILGPMLVMIGEMLYDVVTFCIILLVFICAYGLASQSILYPNSELQFSLFTDIFRKSYWQIYGELFLEEIEGQEECTHEKSLYTNGTLPRCPANSTFVPFMLAFYILFAQVLMLNLLIAMFSYTFDKVREHADIHWMFQRYFVIREYHMRPPLAPPFILLSHIYLLIRYLVRRCSKQYEVEQHCAFKIDLRKENKVHDRQLTDWEKLMSVEYKRKAALKEEGSVESQTKSTKDGVDDLLYRLGDAGRMQTMYDRLEAVDERLEKTSEAVSWIISALQSSKMTANFPAPVFKRLETKQRKNMLTNEQARFETLKESKQGFVHIRARMSPYHNCGLYRSPVPTHKVYWEMDFAEYQPTTYTADSVLSKPDWADPHDLISLPPAQRPMYTYNGVDSATGINRKSTAGSYEVIDMIPRNPYGRTGMMGRGELGRWGPNSAIDSIVTRWKRFPNGKIQEIKGKPILEFVAIQRSDTKHWAIPGKMVRNAEEIPEDTFMAEAFSNCLGRDDMETLQSLFKTKIIIFRGYTDDPRCTDNAWVETVAYNFHDEEDTATGLHELQAGAGVLRAAWLDVSSEMEYYAGHSFILREVAKYRNAHF